MRPFVLSFPFGLLIHRPARGCDGRQKETSGFRHDTIQSRQRKAHRHADLVRLFDLLQTLLTGMTGTSTQSAGGEGGYMGQIVGARARLAQASAEEEQVRVKLDMSRRELGELEKRSIAVEREAGQGERDIKRMQAEVVRPCGRRQNRLVGTKRRNARARRRCAKQRTTQCAVHGYVLYSLPARGRVRMAGGAT